MDGFLPEFVKYHGPATAHEEQTIPNAWQCKLKGV
jgi:hypothetical protein